LKNSPEGHDQHQDHYDNLYELIRAELVFSVAGVVLGALLRIGMFQAAHCEKISKKKHLEFSLQNSPVLFDLRLSPLFSLFNRLFILSNWSIRVSRLSVTLHNSFTAPMFSMKMRSLFTTRKLSMEVPFSRTRSPAGLTASGRILATS
jgi:hypothetical protein